MDKRLKKAKALTNIPEEKLKGGREMALDDVDELTTWFHSDIVII